MITSSVRVRIAYFMIIISYIGILILAFTVFGGIGEGEGFDVGKIALLYGGASIGSGLIGGLIAPYSYKKLFKYIAITLGGLFLLGGIIGLVMWSLTNATEGWEYLILLLLFIVIVIAIVVILIVTTGGLLLGALLGSLIGKTFQENYEKKEEEAELRDMPTL